MAGSNILDFYKDPGTPKETSESVRMDPRMSDGKRGSLSEEMQLGFSSVKTGLTDLHTEVATLNNKIDHFSRRLEASERRIGDVEDRVEYLENVVSEVYRLKEKCDDLENRARRSNLRLVGLPEGTEGRDPVTFMEKFLVEVLGGDRLGPRESSPPDIVWEAFKATIRGKIIALSSAYKQSFCKRLVELERDLRGAETDLYKNNSAENRERVASLQHDLKVLSSAKAERALLRTRSKFYARRDKVGKLLAWQLRKEEADRHIPSITSPEGAASFIPREINKAFRSYYAALYSTQYDAEIMSRGMRSFLDGAEVPEIPEEMSEQVSAPLSQTEVREAIGSLQSGKSPGLDGFTVDFYKAFVEDLIDPLMGLYTHSLKMGSLPLTLRSALITLIPKRGKDLTACGSYHPISLLNVDYKILAKVLVRRVEPLLPLLIHPDQTGFILRRHLADNLRRFFNIIHAVGASGDSGLAISLDVEKAFDRVEWEFLFEVLRCMKFGEDLVAWIKLLYTNPLAQVLTNGVTSSSFPLTRGTRQGGPLSPLLFTIFLEPLAIALRNTAEVRGIAIGCDIHKVALYADDMLLFITSTGSSVPAAMGMIQEFGVFSGYRINWEFKELKPVSDRHDCAGRVEVFYNGTWGSVCSNNMRDVTIGVICQQMGCGNTGTLDKQFGEEGSGLKWLDSISCFGTDLESKDSVSELDYYNEDGMEEISLGFPSDQENTPGIPCKYKCTNEQLYAYSGVFLHFPCTGETGACEGTVEVYSEGRWGTVCSNIPDAEVVCKKLGCGSAVLAPLGNTQVGAFLLNNVHCHGNESHLWQCESDHRDREDCKSESDALIVCSESVSGKQGLLAEQVDLEIRIVESPSPCHGAVQVYYRGVWGSVCSQSGNLKDAAVVCKQLGSGEPEAAPSSYRYNHTEIPIWLNRVQCTENESSLWECQAETLGHHECNHWMDAGVSCKE
nr:PREDICTED: uncharacterized protein LOC102366391 [Latimeria chalumnae]|eukprot:XP_014353709.1 PREDICTED: uncharacterized protein LOC102366391 [Latimeria chalumnae]